MKYSLYILKRRKNFSSTLEKVLTFVYRLLRVLLRYHGNNGDPVEAGYPLTMRKEISNENLSLE